MSKYIHSKMDLYLKSDARKIKKVHNHLKTADILNILSMILGWRHFNELQKNISNLNNPMFNTRMESALGITNIDSYTVIELGKIKLEFFFKINEIFKLNCITEENFTNSEIKEYKSKYDLYKILTGAFYNHKNTKRITLKEGSGEELLISFVDDSSLIKLSNAEIEKMIDFIFKKYSLDGLGGEGMWIGRSSVAFNSFISALKDSNEENWQKKINLFYSFEKLVNYWKNLAPSKGKNILGNYIYMMPGYNDDNSEISQTCMEQHGYVMMMCNIFNEPYFTESRKTKKIYSIDKLKFSQKKIVLEYKDTGNINGNIKILKLFLDKNPDAINDFLDNVKDDVK
jgi:hypothetical protein